MFVRDIFRNGKKIFDWQLKKLGVRAVASDNAENCPVRAMPRIACTAEIALTAASVNFSDDTTPGKGVVRAFFNHTNKLVPDRSFKPSVPARDLEIGVADP
jgi:hypothetical protein